MGDYDEKLKGAIRVFWRTRSSQIKNQKKKDQGTRGAVTGGKQLDGFVELMRRITLDSGVPKECIFTKGNELPGFFRPTKDWDLLVVSPKKTLIACFEFKSQVGSFGNNFNNRTEEAIGSATDIWTAFREGVFGSTQAPWVGYAIIIERCEKSTTPVAIRSPHFDVMREFDKTSYLDRYGILCKKLIRERIYTACTAMWTEQSRKTGVLFGYIDKELSFGSFTKAYIAYLKGRMDEFEE